MMVSVPLRVSIALAISVGLIGVSDMRLLAQGGPLQTQPAPGLQPLPPPTGSTGTLQSSTEFKTLQGVQRLEERVAYLEGLLKTIGSKIDAINTKADASINQHGQITGQLATHPAQHRILPATQRWDVVLNGAAVLDKETGLVWERSPSAEQVKWIHALEICPQKQIGSRSGWRVPTIQELASVAPLTGSPFTNVLSSSPTGQSSGRLWTSTVSRRPSTTTNGPLVGSVSFSLDATFPQFRASEIPGSEGMGRTWCVRGALGFED